MDYIIAIIGGGVGAAVISLISALLQTWQRRKYEKEDRHDEVGEELAGIKVALKSLEAKIDQRDAISSRTHILRFDDELLSKVKHSKEYFRQILDDIDVYEDYCTSHPGFKNGYTVAAVQHIREVYQQCLDENAFI